MDTTLLFYQNDEMTYENEHTAVMNLPAARPESY